MALTMTRRRGIGAAIGLAVAGFAQVLACTGASGEEARQRNITLMVFSDIYELDGVEGRGGFARIAATVAAERARSSCTIIAHAGDTLSPSLMSGLDKGAHIMELTNRVAPDVFVPGNHEFDFGEEVFRQRMSEARFPLLAANLREASGTRVPGFSDNKIIACDGVRIGLFGLTDDEAARKSSPGTLVLMPSIPAAREQAAALRAAGADVVVAVTHSTWQDDMRLAALGVIDVILSGHDHNLWVGYDGRTVIAETQADGMNIVAVDLSVTLSEGPARKAAWRPSFRIIDTSQVTPDAGVAAAVDGYKVRLSQELDVIIGATATPLDTRKASVRGEETAIGNFIADAFRAATGADVAIVNGGSIRGDREYAAGAKLSRRDIRKELPFADKVLMVEMTGQDLREALENGVWFAGKGDGRFAQISGARVTGRKDAVPGSKLDTITIGDAPLDPAKTYKVAATTFIISGKEGYGVFTRARPLLTDDEGEPAVTIVMRAIEKAGTIAPQIDGRIRLD